MDKKQQALQIDMISLLESLGYKPHSENASRAHYRSPLADEVKPSFMIYKNNNSWYDWGRGKGGDVIDFVKEYNKCDFLTAINYLVGNSVQPVYFEKSDIDFEKETGLDILNVQEIHNEALILYANSRGIPEPLLKKYCKQVDFCYRRTSHVTHVAIGFENDKGGYELRNVNHKVCSAPKTWTMIRGTDNHLKCNIYEGFFDFLSHLAYYGLEVAHSDSVIMNGLAFATFIKDKIVDYKVKALYLDWGVAADQTIKDHFTGPGYIDKRDLFKGHDDFNDFLITETWNN